MIRAFGAVAVVNWSVRRMQAATLLAVIVPTPAAQTAGGMASDAPAVAGLGAALTDADAPGAADDHASGQGDAFAQALAALMGAVQIISPQPTPSAPKTRDAPAPGAAPASSTFNASLLQAASRPVDPSALAGAADPAADAPAALAEPAAAAPATAAAQTDPGATPAAPPAPSGAPIIIAADLAATPVSLTASVTTAAAPPKTDAPPPANAETPAPTQADPAAGDALAAAAPTPPPAANSVAAKPAPTAKAAAAARGSASEAPAAEPDIAVADLNARPAAPAAPASPSGGGHGDSGGSAAPDTAAPAAPAAPSAPATGDASFAAALPMTAPPVPADPAALAAANGPAIASQIADQVIKSVSGKSTRFDIALNPAGLGQVNVKVEINAQGQVSAALSFDNPHAAAEAKAHVGELQHALEQAGFNLSQGGLSFDVGGQGASLARQNPGPPFAAPNPAAAQILADAAADPIPSNAALTRIYAASGVNIVI